MRTKVDPERKHTARGVSLPPQLERAAGHRCVDLDMSFSRYVQSLIALDLKRNLVKPQTVKA